MSTQSKTQSIRPEEIPWSGVHRSRALAWACRTDRRLEEAAEIASSPETALAECLRERLRKAVVGNASTEELFAAVEAVHEQLDYLPRPPLPAGLRVFIRELFGRELDARLVIAPTSRASWPSGPDTGAEVPFPVAVIPQADLTNPLMWPLIGLQAAAFPGWEDAEDVLTRSLGPAFMFARAAAMLPGEVDEAKMLWKMGWTESFSKAARDGAAALAEALGDGVLISARRSGVPGEPTGTGAADDAGPVYELLAAAYDEPAAAGDILHAGWLHWYGQVLNKVLRLQEAGAAGFERMRRFVNGVDDLLCRSLDVAAIHRFYASGGAKA